MPNESREQKLIDGFVCYLKNLADDDDLKVDEHEIYNKNCRRSNFADLEFKSVSGQRWAIEAKYGAEANRYNEVHKLFGNLLRETKRDNRNQCRIALLIPACREDFFRKGMNRIAREKFMCFGLLVPVEDIFVFDEDDPSFKRKRWADFYDEPCSDC